MDNHGRARFLVASAVASLVTVLPIAYAHRQSFRTFVSAHGLLHSAITERFLLTGLRPGRPENPFFAGERLWYYWPFHYLAARISDLTHLHPLYAFELIIFFSLCVLWFTAVAIGRRLYGKTLLGLAIGFLALAGANPFGAAMLLGRVAFKGTAVLQDSPNYRRGVFHPILGAARYHDPTSSYGPLFNFFFNISSRPLALASLLAVCLALLVWMQSKRPLALAGIAFSMAICAASSFLIGLAAGFALIGGLIAAGYLTEVAGSETATTGRLFGPIAQGASALLTGMFLAAPTYYYFFLGGGEAGLPAHFQLRFWVLARAVLTGGAIAVMAAVGVFRATGVRRVFLMGTTIAGYVLLSANVLLELPGANEHNLANSATLVLAIAAVGCFAPGIQWPRRVKVLAWSAMLVIFLPTPCIVIYAYLHRPAIALELDGRELRRVPRDSPLAHLYAWVRAKTPTDAIFVIDPIHMLAAGGNVPELPAMTGRVVFTAQPDSYMVTPYADAEFRHTLAIGLFDGRAESAAEDMYLTAFHRPIYVVTTDSAASGALEHRYGPALFDEGDVAVIRIR